MPAVQLEQAGAALIGAAQPVLQVLHVLHEDRHRRPNRPQRGRHVLQQDPQGLQAGGGGGRGAGQQLVWQLD